MIAIGEGAAGTTEQEPVVSTPRRAILTYGLLALSLVLPVVFLYSAMATFRVLIEMQDAHRRQLATTAAALLMSSPSEIASSVPDWEGTRISIYDSELPADHPDAEIVNRMFSREIKYFTKDAGSHVRVFVTLPPRDFSDRLRVAQLDLSQDETKSQPAVLTTYVSAALLAALGSLATLTAYLVLARRSAKLQQLAQLGMMSASLAHEIRNPLGTIKGFAELCRKKAEGASAAYLETILREAGRLEKLVEDLLTYARPRNPSYQVVLWESLTPSLQVPDRQGRSRVLVKPTSPVAIQTDPDILLQILLNLIRNGLEATEQGEVVVSAWAENRSWHVVVDDNGPGIPAHLQKRAFQPFFSSKSYGTGLGLPISQKLSERLGGRLTLTGRKRGGTRARLVLPDAVTNNGRTNREDLGY